MTLGDLITEGENLLKNPRTHLNSPQWINESILAEYHTWKSKSLMHLQSKYKGHPQTLVYEKTVDLDKYNLYENALKLISILKAFETVQPQKDEIVSYDDILSNIFERFNICAGQLKRRHDSRETLKISDEYDVQDLLHALLKLHFNDVRPEEWSPSYAGGNKRMDFLLKQPQIAIEVKMTRSSLKDKQVGEQLIIDIENYQKHPFCQSLYCFVYDPEHLIYNPRGLEDDLNQKSSDDFNVKVFIRPNE